MYKEDWGFIDPWDTGEEKLSMEERVKGLEVTVDVLTKAIECMRIDFEKRLANCAKN